MKLSDLMKNTKVKFKNCSYDLEIKNIVFNSKEVKEGCVFICLKGVNTDGHDYIDEAIKNQATVIVCEKKLGEDIPHIVVENTRQTFSEMSACFFDNCADKLKLIGITGTNGKTTSSMVIKNILMQAGKSVGVIGTLGYFINDKQFDCDLTTPDPMKLHSIFKKMYDSGVEYVVMEVSAHAIALDKIYGLDFLVKAITNITQDHLDYFETIENYTKTTM